MTPEFIRFMRFLALVTGLMISVDGTFLLGAGKLGHAMFAAACVAVLMYAREQVGK
jgi:hypothetical protein